MACFLFSSKSGAEFFGSTGFRETAGTPQSLHRQKTSGMKAPTATKIGSMAVVSSFSYGSLAFGPLGFRTFLASRFELSLVAAASPKYSSSSSGSTGRGGSLGQSGKEGRR